MALSAHDIALRMREFNAALEASRAAAAKRQNDRAAWQTTSAVGHDRFCSAITASDGDARIECKG